MILIDALFMANYGGGPNLLKYLLDEIRKRSLQSNFFLLADARLQHNLSGYQYHQIPASLSARKKFYKNHIHDFNKVFCFSNTPPPVKLNIPVATYFHNQMLLESRKHILDKNYWRFYLRYLFLRMYNAHTDYYIVQTPHMVDDIVACSLKSREDCLQYPFYKLPKSAYRYQPKPGTFLYISTPSFYKNHEKLLKAWELLYNKGMQPQLHLTVDDSAPHILSEIKRLANKGLQIVNHGYADAWQLYSQCENLIYPSLNESFGLALIEAAATGLKILASDLPYVQSVIRPSATFDPHNPVSIAETVAYSLENTLALPEILVKDQIDALIHYLKG